MAESIYFVALLPDKAIQEEVTHLKEMAAGRFGSRHALKSPPHITLIPPFKRSESILPSLREALAEAASRLAPFTIRLQNFGHFGQRVIYVKVSVDETLTYCQRATASVFEKKLGIRPEPRPFHPHMTVAFRDLSQQIYPEAWAYFSALSYERSFTATALTLLRHTGRRWELAGEQSFG